MKRSAVNPRPSVSPYGAGAPGALPRLLPVGLTSLDGHLARYGQLPRWAPGELIAEVDRAGLTGRGGAGFPTARKLAAVSARRNPGADAASTTRAITIGVPAHHVWPWLAQLGYGRAGWYSYDWLDNDGQPSARRIQPEWQQLRPGDRILMMPGSGFDVAEVQDGHYFTARAPDQAMSWCLAVEPADQRSCRVISRWRARWHVTRPAPPGSRCPNPVPSSWSDGCCWGSGPGPSRRHGRAWPSAGNRRAHDGCPVRHNYARGVGPPVGRMCRSGSMPPLRA